MFITKIYFPVFQIKFVVSKNCQHLLKKVVFGQSSYRFWDNAGVMTDTGMLSLLILLGKVILSFFCAAFMTFLAVPVYVVLSLVSWCLNIKWSACRYFELWERPCQRFLLELWWFIGFLSLIIITSSEKNFRSQRLPSGLSLPGKHILSQYLTLSSIAIVRELGQRARPLCLKISHQISGEIDSHFSQGFYCHSVYMYHIFVINITISFFTIIITTVNFYFLLSDILVFVFVVTFSLRRLICFWRYLLTIPRYRRNWRLILPEFLTFVECASLLCFTTAFSLWITRWNDLDGWRPSDEDYQLDDVFYSLGSLLSFFRLAHYLKVREIINSDLK